MRVLEINSVCGTGSTGRICTDLAQLLTQRGDMCAVGYGRGYVPPQAQKVFAAAGIFRIIPLEEGANSNENKTE